MADIKDWKQKEVAEKLGVTPTEAKAFRDEYLAKGVDWDKTGATIYWTDHALWMLKKHLATPVTETEGIEVYVIEAARNPRFVYGDLNGSRIPIECSQKLSSRIVKKKIKISLREENGETYYSYNP